MSTPKEIFEIKIPEKLIKNADKIVGIKAIYEFNITGDNGGIWTLDMSGEKNIVKEGPAGDAQCTITMAADDFSELINGGLNPQMAFMTGKLKVAGDMGLALKLGNIIG